MLAHMSRDKGVDAARALALLGMVIAHIQTDVFSMWSLRIDSPVWEFVLSMFSNRARPLFILIAGFAAATLIRSRSKHFMYRRAIYVTAIGLALIPIGWSDITLVFYGIIFLVAPLLARLTSNQLAVTAVALLSFAAFLLIGKPENLVAGLIEYPFYFIVGMWAASQDRKTLRTTALFLIPLFIPFAIAVGFGNGIPNLGSYQSEEFVAFIWWQVLLFVASNVGFLFLTIELCRRMTARDRFQTLVALGSMPLTAYVAHCVVLIVIRSAFPQIPAIVFASACVFLVVLALIAKRLYRLKKSAPLEALLKRITRVSKNSTN
jgi:uncharacterized membrane protein YeiB